MSAPATDAEIAENIAQHTAWAFDALFAPRDPNIECTADSRVSLEREIENMRAGMAEIERLDRELGK